MNSILGILALLAFGDTAQAQSGDDLQIIVLGFHTATHGAERPIGGALQAPVKAGVSSSGVFSMYGCGLVTENRGPAAFSENALAGWRVEITPMSVLDYAVTFRLRWTRALDTGKDFTPVGEDVEVTLKPGQSRLIDSVSVVPPATPAGPPCRIKTAGLRVSAEFDSFDRRLIDADVWLVEKLPNGKEDTQLQLVRGTPHRAIPFYFDSIAAGQTRVDVFGHLVAYFDHGEILVNVEVVRGRQDPGQSGYQSLSWYRSSIRVKPGEIVEVALPPRNTDSAFLGNRTFAVRLRPRQAR